MLAFSDDPDAMQACTSEMSEDEDEEEDEEDEEEELSFAGMIQSAEV